MIADGETGFLVPPDDVGALAQALVTATADTERLRSMGLAAKERNREIHGWDGIALRHEEIYREIVAGPDAT
jgi:mannosyltransferase